MGKDIPALATTKEVAAHFGFFFMHIVRNHVGVTGDGKFTSSQDLCRLREWRCPKDFRLGRQKLWEVPDYDYFKTPLRQDSEGAESGGRGTPSQSVSLGYPYAARDPNNFPASCFPAPPFSRPRRESGRPRDSSQVGFPLVSTRCAVSAKVPPVRNTGLPGFPAPVRGIRPQGRSRKESGIPPKGAYRLF